MSLLNDNLLAVGTDDCSVFLWNLTTGVLKNVFSIQVNDANEILDISLINNSYLIVILMHEPLLVMFDINKNEFLTEITMKVVDQKQTYDSFVDPKTVHLKKNNRFNFFLRINKVKGRTDYETIVAIDFNTLLNYSMTHIHQSNIEVMKFN